MGSIGGKQLLERDADLSVLERRMAEALGGDGGLVLVEGSAGAGKTVLLSELRARAAAAGEARVLRAVGGELERDFPFGLVRQVFEPVVIGADPARRDRLLSGAASLAAGVVGAPSVAAPSADAMFGTLHGLYWLTAALAEEGPLLLLVDDAHWADSPSLRFVDFLARRAPELPVLIVVSARPEEPGSDRALLAGLAEVPGADVVRPAPLSADAVRALVVQGLEREAAEDVVTAALEATGGNPLLLTELVRSLAAGDAQPTVTAVRESLPSSVARSVERRLRRLPGEAQTVARALATLGGRGDLGVLSATTGMAGAAVDDALESLRGAELVEDDPPRFVHPLIRAAVAESVGPAERNRLHRAAAELLAGRPGARDEVVMHLLATAPSGDPWVVDTLRESARRAATEGAPDAAVRQLLRALQERPEADPGLHLEVGRVQASAGDPSFVEHLSVAVRSSDPKVRNLALETLVGVGAGNREPDIAAVLRDAARVLGDEPDPAVRERLGSVLIDSATLELRAEDRAQIFAVLASEDGSGVGSHRSFEVAAGVATAAEVVAQADKVLAPRPCTELANVEYPKPFWALEALISVDGADATSAMLADADATTRRHSSRLGRAFVGFMRAEWELSFGSMAVAESAAREAIELWQHLGIGVSTDSAMATLAQALTRRGRLDDAEAALTQVASDDHFGQAFGGGSVWAARAELRMAQGRPRDAVTDQRRVAALADRFGWARFPRMANTAKLARALVAAGQVEEGRALAEAEAADCRRRGALSFEAEALVSLGRALGGDAGIEALRAAVEVAERSPALFTRATASFELGAALRRSGHRTDARERLSVARELAHRAGATGLVNQATDELTVAGARPRRIALSGAESLSAAERRVAERAAEGLSNREIAEALFVTRKTVEAQLGSTYSKLGIRSRAQLPEALRGAAVPA